MLRKLGEDWVIFSHIETHSPTCHLAELLLHRYPPSGEHWWEARDAGDRIVRGGRAGWEHRGRDMLFCGGCDQVQSQIFGRRGRALGGARPDRAHWSMIPLSHLRSNGNSLDKAFKPFRTWKLTFWDSGSFSFLDPSLTLSLLSFRVIPMLFPNEGDVFNCVGRARTSIL